MSTQDNPPPSSAADDSPPAIPTPVMHSADKSLPSLPHPPPHLDSPFTPDPIALEPPALGARGGGTGSSGYSTANEGAGLSSLPLLAHGARTPSSLSADRGTKDEAVPVPSIQVDESKRESEGDRAVPAAGVVGGQGQGGVQFVEKTKDFGFLPIPRHLRFHPDRPFHFFSMS